MRSRANQSGYVMLVFVALVASAVAISVGMMVAQMKKDGQIDRSFGVGAQAAAQAAKLAVATPKLTDWYVNNAWALDSNPSKPGVAATLTAAGVSLGGAVADATPRLTQNGIAYHVFAMWFPVPGAIGTGLDQTTGQFIPGTIGGQPAQPQYALVSGFPIEAKKQQDTRTRMASIADKLTNYFSVQAANDPNSNVNTNWFRDSACSPTSVALPCYDTDTDVTTTTLATTVGLSSTDMIGAWYDSTNPSTAITVNNLDTSGPPFKFTVGSVTPWGSLIDVIAISN